MSRRILDPAQNFGAALISQGWDYVTGDPYEDYVPPPRPEPLTPEEKLANAIEAQGTPPCGSMKGNRCGFWDYCAAKQAACREYKDWQSRVGASGNKNDVERRDNKTYGIRAPSRTIYNRIFGDGE